MIETRSLDFARAGVIVDSQYFVVIMRPGRTNTKDQNKDAPQASTSSKPPRAKVTDVEFRRRLKNIDEWRRKELEKLRKPHTRG
jgi:hypothetical protein